MLAEGLADSRQRAQALIRTGDVLVDDTPVDKPGTRVRAESVVRLRAGAAPSPYVSRGGEKLAGALDDLGIDPRDRVCLDIGASTGGFSDCLLQRGARHVVAVDVGYGQLHARLRGDDRVTVLERTHVRDLDDGHLASVRALGEPEWAVVDVSFISSRVAVTALARVAPRARLLVMVKPQFEVGRERVGKGGVVRDDTLRSEAVDSVAAWAADLGYAERGRAESRVAGPKGNREVFLWLEPRAEPADDGESPVETVT